MNKQLLFLSLAAAALFAGCARNEIDGGGVSVRQISATATGSESPESKAPLMGTSLNGQQAQIYTTTSPLEAYTGDKTKMFTDAYAAGTMTFADNLYAQYDAGFSGTALLPGDKSEVYLYGFYPLGWTSASGGSYESLSHTFDGKTDLMATWVTAADQQKIAYQGGISGTLPGKAEFMFRHLLTCYNIRVVGADAAQAAAWGRIKSINLKNRAIDKVSTGENLGYTYSAGGGAVSFYKLAGTPGAPTYSDDVFEQTAFANMLTPTTTVQTACYSMAAPVMVDGASATAELTLVVKTLDTDGGTETTVEIPVSLDQTKFAANGNSTRGYTVSITLSFTLKAITPTASIGEWATGDTYEQELLPPQINPPAASDIVTIKGLQWTKGNLVAKNSNECKVGAPTDYGVYFQFGSLVGWTGGNVTNGDGTGQGKPATVDKAVWPSAMGTSKPSYAWPSKDVIGISTLAHYYFNYSAAPWATQGQNIREFAVAISGDSGSGTLADGRYAALGVGDPCTYYLGAPWRLPTTTELASITGKTGSSQIAWTTSGLTGRWAASGVSFGGVSGPGGWFGSSLSAGSGTPKVSVNPFFPASGCRADSGGSFNNVAFGGYCWSSSVDSATRGLHLYFTSSWVYPQGYSPRSYGIPVRCVSSVP